jgi:hypothetical protein
MGMTLAMLFSQAPCGLLLPHSDFYLRLRKGRLMALFYRLPFSIRLSPSQNHGFCVCGQNTRISTVPTCGIGLPFRSVWLFDTLFKRSKTHGRIFDFPSLKNRFPTKKAFVFSLLRFLLSVSYLLTFFVFTIYRLVAVVSLLKVCIFFVSVFPVCLSGLFPFRVQFNSKTNFSILQIIFFVRLKKRL